jgi:hypothetical protein
MLILMSICLLSNPSDCREERLSFSFEEANAISCVVRSQEKIAEWQQSHPDYRIDRWKCVSRGPKSQDI